MEHIDMVEKLTEKTGVTLAEAKEALETADWDMLDAMILLEQQGKTQTRTAQADSARNETGYAMVEATASREDSDGKPRPGALKRFFGLVKKIVRKGMENHLVITRNGHEVLDLPVTITVLLFLLMFWLCIILLVVALVMGCQFSFRGTELGKETINQGLRKATDAAQELTEKVKHAVQNEK